jgi:hypothetical protein
MPKVRCVSYADKFSADKSSLRDLTIGLEHRVVGCNSKTFGASKQGDFVIICARHQKRLYTCIGVLEERVNTTVWADRGGQLWTYNFSFTPLTEVIEVDSSRKDQLKKVCDEHNVNHNHMFNMRFCGERYLKIIQRCLADGIF